MTNIKFNSELNKATYITGERRLIFAVYCYTRNDDMAYVYMTILWQPAHGRANQGRPAYAFTDSLKENMGLEPVALHTVTRDIDVWRHIIGASTV